MKAKLPHCENNEGNGAKYPEIVEFWTACPLRNRFVHLENAAGLETRLGSLPSGPLGSFKEFVEKLQVSESSTTRIFTLPSTRELCAGDLKPGGYPAATAESEDEWSGVAIDGFRSVDSCDEIGSSGRVRNLGHDLEDFLLPQSRAVVLSILADAPPLDAWSKSVLQGAAFQNEKVEKGCQQNVQHR